MNRSAPIVRKPSACATGMVTVQGPFSLIHNDNQSLVYHNITGYTVLSGCVEGLIATNLSFSTEMLNPNVSSLQPFWASVNPLIFAIAVSITLSYVLLLISVMAKTKRPWLQRCAALSACVPLTLAADLMWVELEKEQNTGMHYNADKVRDVRANTALKVLRLIANALLWLAQVQVLIRLFPRHRDKVIIKWTGLCLIVLQTTFAVLNDFFHPSPFNPSSTNELIPAIPVLSYLFHIALGVLYAVCVVFYSMTSGRWRYAYSFQHLLNATASLVSVACPIIFFCLDIWDAEVDGWGDYARLVSNVAASVIVWDWVDEIELCIHKSSNSGVLGREVFEDEMIDTKPSKTRSKDFGHKRRTFTPHIWTARVSNAFDDAPVDKHTELPIIQHPLVRCGPRQQSPASTDSGPVIPSHYAPSNSVVTTSTTTRSNLPRTSIFDRPRSSIQDIGNALSQSDHTSAASSRDLPEHAVGISAVNTNSAHLQELGTPSSHIPLFSNLHRGFSRGDYWPDVKEGG